jgi:exopolysaccharide production protein ExoQ
VSRPMRAPAPQNPRNTNRHVGPTISRVGGAGALVVLSILFWLIFYQNLPTDPTYNTSNTLDRIVKLSMIAMSLYVIATRWVLTRALAKCINAGAAAFAVLCALSAVWSIEPAATLLRFVSLAAIVLLCFAISLTGWHPRRFQQVAIPPMMFILVASLVLGMVAPEMVTEIGTDISQKDAWRGITLTKNEFGMMASIGVIICVNGWLSREGRAYWSIAGIAVAFTCLILSRSNTSLFATIVGVLFMVLVMRVPVIKRRYSTHVAVAIAVTILVSELAIQQLIPGVSILTAPITSLTGKDTSFSARTVIWNIIKEHIQAAPYLGTGYGAYWLGPVPTSPSYIFLSLMYFYPTESHNGYLEVVNDLGILGLICLLLFLFWFIRQALQLMQIDRSQAALYLALLFQQMVMNMSESEWFSRTSTFAIFILAITCLSRGLFEVRLHGQSVGSAGR